MATKVRDLLRRAFRARDQAEFEQIEKEIPPEEGERGDLTGDPSSSGGPLESRDDHIHIHLPSRRDDTTMAREEPRFDRRDDRRRDFGGRRSFTDPGGDPGEEPGAEPGEMGGGDIGEMLQMILARLESLEDMLGAGHGGSTDRGRDDRRRDGWHHFSRGRDRGRGRDDDDCRDTRDEEGVETGEDGPKTISIEEAKGEHEIPGNLEMEAPTGTTSDRRSRDRGRTVARDAAPTHDAEPVRDSSALAGMFRDTISGAEILAPGIELPAFDAKAPSTKTHDCICDLQRTALDLARNTPELRREIEALTAGQTISRLTTDELRTVFRAAALFKSKQNNSGPPISRYVNDMTERGYGGGTGVRGRVKSPADINAMNRAFYADAKR